MTKERNDKQDRKDHIQYGNPIVGVWRCPNCHYQCFPLNLKEIHAKPPFQCPECGSDLYYDEEE